MVQLIIQLESVTVIIPPVFTFPSCRSRLVSRSMYGSICGFLTVAVAEMNQLRLGMFLQKTSG